MLAHWTNMRTIVFHHIISLFRPLSFKRCQNNAWLSVWIKNLRLPLSKKNPIWVATQRWRDMDSSALFKDVPISERLPSSTKRCQTRLSKTAAVDYFKSWEVLIRSHTEAKSICSLKKDKQSKLGCETIFNKPPRVKISWSFSGIEITNHSSFLSLFASKAMNILAILMTQPLYKLSAFPFILKF